MSSDRPRMQTSAPHLIVSKNPQEAAGACATHILQSLEEALKTQPSASFAISGGTSPKLVFQKLAQADFNWQRIHFFWVDERCVPPDDGQSNFKLTNDALFRPANIPESNIHRIYGELTPAEGAAKYVAEIKAFFNLTDGQLPLFDLLHRGMGPDAHTASLFPGEPLIDNKTDIAANVWVEKFKMHRVTLLPGVLLAAKETVLQVVGEDKAEALRNVLTAPEDPKRYPCQIASRDSNATWFLDTAAAAQLPSRNGS